MSRPFPQRVAAILRTLGSLLPGSAARRGDASRLLQPWRADSARTYPTVGLTPARVLSFLQAADAGWPQTQFELFGEMLQKWPRLAAVEATRRLALTGLDWEIAPPPDGEPGAAAEIIEYCRRALLRRDSFRAALDHLANALGYGLAVVELVWDRGQLVDLAPVP